MTRIIRPRKTILNPDQIPMLTPESDWRTPKELPDLSKIDVVAIDTEEKDDGLANGRGPGWAFGSGYVSGVSAAWRAGKEMRSIFVPIAHPDSENFPKENVANWLKHIFDKCRVVFCNAAFDVGWCDTDLHVPPPRVIDDIGCMAFMIDENRRGERGVDSPYSLNGIAHWLGVEGKDESLLLDAAISYGFRGRTEVKKNMYRLPARYVGPYAEQDAVSTLLCREIMNGKIDDEDMRDAYQTEMDLVPLIHYMRKRGIRLDTDGAEALRDDLFKRRDELLAELSRRIPGRRDVTMGDIRSSNWLIQTFEAEGVEFRMEETDASKRYRKYGGGSSSDMKASFKKDWMRADPHWLPRFIAEAKQCHEAGSKFVEGYLLEFAHRGRIHASINQYMSEEGGTRSHRFSYADPPLQQMPSRPDPVEGWDLTEKIAKALRSVILPEEGELWFAPDYSQQEYRLIVHYASLLNCDKADDAVDKYNSDPKTDFHNLVVDLTGLTRRRAKDCNFAKAYGAGVPKFAIMTGMTLEEAGNVMGQYDREMPFVKQLNDKCSKSAQTRGFIRMIDGARSHFDSWEAAYLTKEERNRGWSEGRVMTPCRLDEARARAQDKHHPWFGKRLKRADAHKAMNRLIQGSAARQVKKAMVACWREKLYPMIQIHDELGFSVTDEKVGQHIGEIMREVIKLRVPMRVDEEYGSSWGDAKHSFAEAATAAGILPKPKAKRRSKK